MHDAAHGSLLTMSWYDFRYRHKLWLIDFCLKATKSSLFLENSSKKISWQTSRSHLEVQEVSMGNSEWYIPGIANSVQNRAWFCLHFSDYRKPKETDVIFSRFVSLSFVNQGRLPRKKWPIAGFPLGSSLCKLSSLSQLVGLQSTKLRDGYFIISWNACSLLVHDLAKHDLKQVQECTYWNLNSAFSEWTYCILLFCMCVKLIYVLE